MIKGERAGIGLKSAEPSAATCPLAAALSQQPPRQL